MDSIMKINYLPLAALSLILLAACKGENKAPESTGVATSATTDGKMAYVDLDSLQNNYQYFLDEKAAAEQMVKQYQAAVQTKENALQKMQADIQNRMQTGKFTSQEQYQAAINGFQKQQEAYARFRSEQEQKIAREQERVNTALQDSLDHFLVEYNKTKKFSVIINKATLLYADKAMDITKEVTAGLNKRYKKK